MAETSEVMKEAKALSVAEAESIFSTRLALVGGRELVRPSWRLNGVEYLITCTISSSAR
jgi:hypothetical protein